MREIKFRAFGRLGYGVSCMVDSWQDSTYIEDVGFSGGGYFEVMQYTGLKDKNGVEIFESDIVSNPRLRKGGISTVEATELGGWAPFEYDGGGNEYPDDVEVIGNIFESPELLEKD